jgi:hypothetical protein
MSVLARFGDWQTRGRTGRQGSASLLLPALVGLAAAAMLALGYVAHVLWPRWPQASIALDAPPLPIVISGVVFNVPPAAIRVALQRHPGTQERIDLVYLWPALTPPPPAAKPTLDTLSPNGDRIFVTISTATAALPATERLQLIYARYIDIWPIGGPEGLAVFAFRDNSPYRGEDLLVDRVLPERFIARCTRDDQGATRGICLTERRVGKADITFRFPRSWMSDWRNVAGGIDRLIAQLHPSNE